MIYGTWSLHAPRSAPSICTESRIHPAHAQPLPGLQSTSKNPHRARVGRTCASRAHSERIRTIFSRERPRFDPDPRASARKVASLSSSPTLGPPQGSFHPGWRRSGTTAAGLRRGSVGERAGVRRRGGCHGGCGGGRVGVAGGRRLAVPLTPGPSPGGRGENEWCAGATSALSRTSLRAASSFPELTPLPSLGPTQSAY
jgi:hypothetical protein